MTDVRDMARSEGRGIRDLMRTMASTSSDPDFLGGLGWLPNPDRVLAKLGVRDSVLEDVRTDAHVFSLELQRKAATTGLEWAVTEASSKRQDRKAADLCRAVLEAIDLEALVSTLLDAPLWGRAYAEVLWGYDGGQLVPTSVVDRPRRRFVYTPEGELRLTTREAPLEGVPVPARKILQARLWPTADNPYGEAALSRCFWPWTFKHNDLKFWVILAERYGIPWVIGKVPTNASDAEVARVLGMLRDLRQDGTGTIPDTGQVEIKEASAQAKGELHATLVRAMNAEISKALLGQTLTSEVGDKGSYAASKTHGEVRGDIAAGDQRLVESVIDEFCVWITETNVPAAAPPSFAFLQEEDREQWLKLFQGGRQIGLPMSRNFVHDKLQIPPPEGEDDELGPATEDAPGDEPPAAAAAGAFAERGARRDFAEREPLDVGNDAAELLATKALDGGRRSLSAAVERVLTLVEKSVELGELGEMLLAELPSLDLREAAEQLARAAFAAELNGRLSVVLEQESGDFASADEFLFEPLPFEEAIEFFKGRVPLTPNQARRLPLEARNRAFWMAGVQKKNVVGALHGAVVKALEEGTTLVDFKREAESVIAKAGLAPAGAWHLETVFRAQVQSSYNAGRYKQMTDPGVMKLRPYWQYVTVGDRDVRPAHAVLHGRVYRADDPIWDTLYPPNGFRCRCQVRTLSQRQLDKKVADGSATFVPPDESANELENGVGRDGQTIPIRPPAGWSFNPGKAAWGGPKRFEVAGIPPSDREGWEVLGGPANPERHGLDAKHVMVQPTDVELFPSIRKFGSLDDDRQGTLDRLWQAFAEHLGASPDGEDIFVRNPLGDAVNLNRRFFDHVMEGDKPSQRAPFLPLMAEVVRRPSEMWLLPMRSRDTGKVVLRTQYLARFELPDERVRGAVLAAEFEDGSFVGWSAYAPKREKDVRRLRAGSLQWKAARSAP